MFVTDVLDVFVMAHWLYVLTILVLADVADQQDVSVSYVARVVACVWLQVTEMHHVINIVSLRKM